jgi:hypothetical protein
LFPSLNMLNGCFFIPCRMVWTIRGHAIIHINLDEYPGCYGNLFCSEPLWIKTFIPAFLGTVGDIQCGLQKIDRR